MRYLKNATATKITVGPFLTLADGVTPLTTLTVASATFTILSDTADTPHVVATGALAASDGDNDLVHITNDTAGFWSMELSEANTTHIGSMVVSIMDNDVFFPISHEFTVLHANVYDSLMLGTDSLNVNVVKLSGDSTAANNAESFFDGTGYAGTGNVIPTVTAFGTQAKADINAEVVDALNVDTYAEPGQEAPAATTTITKKLGYLYKAVRNKITQDATTLKLYNDDTTTVDHKATVSDSAGTFTRGELGTGP